MICPACDCGCLILPYKCLYEKNSNLRRFKIEERPEILNAVNSFVLIGDSSTGGMLGEDCFNELCSDIKQAYASAESFRSLNPSNTSEQSEFWYYLQPKWYSMLKNGYFQSMYSSYCLYYYYNSGVASSETTLDGDVSHARPSTGNDGEQSSNISASDAMAKAATHLAFAKKYAAMFKDLYLQKNLSLYPCLNICGCGSVACSGCEIPNKDGSKKPIGRKPRPTVI